MAAVRAQKAQDIEEEYNSTLRSQSKEMEALLETQEIIISPVLHNMMVHRRTSSEIELAMANYFDATTEALGSSSRISKTPKATTNPWTASSLASQLPMHLTSLSQAATLSAPQHETTFGRSTTSTPAYFRASGPATGE